ncbi:MAG: hypothetical protein ACOCRX_04980 [Candidatus Woesearchaeota archaeon]
MFSFINFPHVYLAVDLHNNYGGTYVPITAEHHPDAKGVLRQHVDILNQSEIIMFDTTNHLIWFFPQMAQNKEVIKYRCNNEDYNESKMNRANNAKTALISTWRKNRGNCIEKEDILEKRKKVFIDDGYYIYKNFD